MMQIDGLSQRQRAIADVLWMINGRDQVDLFLKSLEKDTRRDAEVVIEMMIASLMDEISEIEPEVKDLLDRFGL
jgi:hypothetical protein